MIKENNNKIKKFFDLFKETDIEDKLKIKLNSYFATISSLDTLNNMNKIIHVYLKREDKNEEIVLLNLFGVLQALFVSIDSLYALSYGITDRKWSVNVNYNDHLRKIKFIRNDVVGHPTRRIYSDNVIGYCDLNLAETTYFNLVYRIFTAENNTKKIVNHEIDMKKIIANYYMESGKILDEIYGRILLLNGHGSLLFPQIAYKIYKDYQKGVRNKDQVIIMKEKYIGKYNLKKNSNDRFIWRLNHILEAFKWDEQNNSSIINYIVERAIKKVYLMSADIDNELPRLKIKIKVPYAIRKFRMLLNKMKIPLGDYNYLKDSTSPMFFEMIKKISDFSKNDHDIIKVLKLFENNHNIQTRLYLLGSALDKALK